MNLQSTSDMLAPENIPRSVHIRVCVVFIASVAALAAVDFSLRDADFWNGFREAGEFRKPKYSETISPRDLFRTQANTWSNLAYAVVGYYAIAFAWHDSKSQPSRPNYLLSTPAISLLFGTACCFLAFGSGLFHASLTRWGQQLDVTAMYSPLLALIACNVGRRLPRVRSATTWPALWMVVLVCTTIFYVYKWSMSSTIVLTALILTVAAFVFADMFRPMSKSGVVFLITSIVALVLAVTCRELDINGRFSTPNSVFQGHAVWHLLTALSLAAIYGYYRVQLPADITLPNSG